MTWHAFALGLAPYLVTLVGLILAAFWGSKVLAAKEAQLRAKDEQINTLKLMMPERVVENVRALHAYYQEEAELTKTKLHKASEHLAAAGNESQELRAEVGQLREQLSIFEFGTASTAPALLEESTLTSTNLSRLVERSVRGRSMDNGAAGRPMTEKKLQDLKDASLTSLLENEPANWKAKATHAYVATSAFIKNLRPDDVLPLLIAELEVTPEFRNYLARKKLRQKYWSEWFAELIIDRFWSELKQG